VLHNMACSCEIPDCRWEGRCLCSVCPCQRGAKATATARFSAQAKQAARKIQQKYPVLFGGKDIEDAESKANERLLVYAGDPAEGDCRAGILREWEHLPDDEQNKLVLNALYWDLQNYAKKESAHREILCDPSDSVLLWGASDDLASTGSSDRPNGITRWVKDAEYDGSLSRYPTLAAYYRDGGVTQAEVAKELGVTVRTVQRRIDDETRRFMEENPRKIKAWLKRHGRSADEYDLAA
jgi:hypothetical protein